MPQKLSHGGLNRSEIEALPTFIYSQINDLKVGKGGSLECAVCLGEFMDHDSLRILSKCDHLFHLSCIDPWLTSKSTCPVCRADVIIPNKLTPELSTQLIPIASASSSSNDYETEPRNCRQCEKDEIRAPESEGCSDGPDRMKSESVGIRSSTGIWKWNLSRSNSTGHSMTVDGIDASLVLRILSEEERRQIMRPKASVALPPPLASDRRGYRRGAGEGDESDNQESSLPRRCSESIIF